MPLRGRSRHGAIRAELSAKDGATNVTWAMYGPAAYIGKVMGIFFSMDSMIGKDFATGLANLKAHCEM